MSDILQSALDYALKGYFVYPVNLTIDDQGKKRVDFPGNWRESTNDRVRVRELFGPDVSGIAIDTGKSGIVVVDVDLGNGKFGLQNLRDAGVELPVSPSRVRTWSGGFHGYFRQPEGQPIGSGSNKPVSAVDFRGMGGVVFAPPTTVSDVASGVVGEYTEIAPILAVADLPPLPEGYASRLRLKPADKKVEAPTGVSSQIRDDQAKLLGQFVDGDLEEIRMAGSGERNEALGRTTLRLADRCLKLGYGYTDYLDMVVEAYQASGGTDQQQVLDWVRNSWKKAQDEPLSMPRTYIDELADKEHAKLLARRLANAKLIGATSQYVTEDSFVDWTVTPPPPAYWLHGVIPQGEQTLIYGEPEAGKTFMALDWAMSIATGRTAWGRRTTQGRVWFMAGEGNARITSRMHAWMDYHQITPDPDMLRLANHVPDFMNNAVMESMALKVARDQIDFVVVDTLGRAMSIGGGDVSETKDAAQALRSMSVISKYRPTTTVMAIHHPTKSGGMAGAYNLLAGLDVALFAEADDGLGSLRFAKNKDGEKKKICEYEWKPVGSSAVLVPAYEERNHG